MRLRDRLRLAGRIVAGRYKDYDDFWYTADPGSAGGNTHAGISITAESAMRVSAVGACVRLISSSTAMLPLIMYQRLADGGKRRAEEHPLYYLLHDEPNPEMSAYEFRQMLTAWVALRGNAYAEKVPGPRGFVDTLWPIHPAYVTPRRIPATGRIVYDVRDPERGGTRRLAAEDLLHLRDLSLDGIVGLSRIAQAREGIGLAVAAEVYGSRFFGNGARPGGILKTDKPLSDQVRARTTEAWKAAHQGPERSNRVAVLDGGLEWQAIGVTNEDSQFLETRHFQVADIARFYGVPLHLIQETEKSTSWGTGIEQMGLGFVTYTLGPWLAMWENAIQRSLVIAKRLYFAEHLAEGLLRGDLATRVNAYGAMINWGILSPNEARARENMNARDGGEKFYRPANVMDANAPEPIAPAAPAPPSRGSNGERREKGDRHA